jgi:hypothetical protein
LCISLALHIGHKMFSQNRGISRSMETFHTPNLPCPNVLVKVKSFPCA